MVYQEACYRVILYFHSRFKDKLLKRKLPHSFHLLPFNANLLRQCSHVRQVMQSCYVLPLTKCWQHKRKKKYIKLHLSKFSLGFSQFFKMQILLSCIFYNTKLHNEINVYTLMLWWNNVPKHILRRLKALEPFADMENTQQQFYFKLYYECMCHILHVRCKMHTSFSRGKSWRTGESIEH